MVAEVEAAGLIHAVNDLRDAVQATQLPLRTPNQPAALDTRRQLIEQLDDYVLPRLNSLEAPLLAVVGGSTGAGKSTLVNSLVGSQASPAGVLRPTTTMPVLVHHPDDAHWFRDHRILPGLARVAGTPREQHSGSLRLVASSALPPGMALLDAPDIDSVVRANRELAGQLLAAADLWLFVTTAARYADAVPWDLLRTASERGTAIAIVLDRIAAESVEEIRPHLVGMLREQGLGTAPVFTVPDSDLLDGRLPPEAIARLKAWLTALSSDPRARAIVVGQTLRGALSSLDARTLDLAQSAREQSSAATDLQATAAAEFARSLAQVEDGMRDGTLLRGEVLARWQEFVGTGEFFRNVETTVGRWRDRLVGAVTGTSVRADSLGEALETGVAALVSAHGEAAVSQVVREWRRQPGGEALLADNEALTRTSPLFRDKVEQLVRAWQGEIFEMVRTEGGNRRTNARVAAYGVNGIGFLLILVTFAQTGLLTGAEVGIAGGTSVLAQRVLEAIFGDQAVRTMAVKARAKLLERVGVLYANEQGRYDGVTGVVGDAQALAERLELAATRIRESTP